MSALQLSPADESRRRWRSLALPAAACPASLQSIRRTSSCGVEALIADSGG